MSWIERYRKAVVERFGKYSDDDDEDVDFENIPLPYDEDFEDEPLPHTRTNPTLNSHISEIINDFQTLIEKAKSYGLDIKLTPTSTDSLELYFHDDYPDTILVDKFERRKYETRNIRSGL